MQDNIPETKRSIPLFPLETTASLVPHCDHVLEDHAIIRPEKALIFFSYLIDPPVWIAGLSKHLVLLLHPYSSAI